jgi:SSS family solute:Na+ symporter
LLILGQEPFKIVKEHPIEDGALWIQDILVALEMAYAYLSGCVFVPVLASFVLKKFSPKAGLYSLGVSAVVVTVVFFRFGLTSNYPILLGMLSGLIVYAIINAMSQRKMAPSLRTAR